MPDPKQHLLGPVRAAESRWDAFRLGLRERLGRMGPAMIVPYRGYGTEDTFYLKGRVLKDRGIPRAGDADALLKNAWRMARRFASAEIPHVRVQARSSGAVQAATADEEGYFEVHLRLQTPLRADRIWHPVDLELLDRVEPHRGPVRAEGSVLVPPIERDFGVISDLDDTVLQTGATDLLQMLKTTMLRNARTRLPFEGVAAFYLALQRGPSGTGHNPCFYVSSSPWNLYDFLTDFLSVNGIPSGPLMLRDLGLGPGASLRGGHAEHKLAAIEQVLATYPDLPFLLIGDSGQEDPEIYRQAVQDFPGRIRAVYVRDVTTGKRDAEVHAIAEEIRAAGVPMLLLHDTERAAVHAAEHGFLHPDALAEVRAEKAKDEAV